MSRSRALRRLPLALAAALVIASLAASAVLAGGMAIVVPIAGDGQAITAGVAHPLQFEVLQHGVTPVEHEQINVVFTDTASGEQLSQVARPTDKVGTFAVDVVLPRAGWWTWHVVVTGLEIQSGPLVLGVMGRDGAVPGYPPVGFEGVGSGDLAAGAEAELAALRSERDALAVERSALATRVTELESSATMPLIVAAAAILLAALVGAGIALAVRARAPGVRPTSPSGEPGAFATETD